LIYGLQSSRLKPLDFQTDSENFPVTSTIRIATRSSNLALWQANHVADLIRASSPESNVELVLISTTGDRDQTERLRDLGSFGVFTREVQLALLDGRADVAVHSLKDLPTDEVEGLTLAATPVRGKTADALVMPRNHPGVADIASLPLNSRIGTGSPRRQAQLRHLRSDLQLSEVRGNVETRLRKLDEGHYEALVLAAAGLTRLGLGSRISRELPPPILYPAVGQGAIGIECRSNDLHVREVLSRINDSDTYAAITAERSLLATLRAGCHAPLGVSTHTHSGMLKLEAVVLSPDGASQWKATATGSQSDARFLGQLVATRLIAQGADRVLHGKP
jgi:hydroxymethylbilane synthase